MRQGSIHRWLAVLFLLVASADISADVVSPQECCEELGGLASSSFASKDSLSQTPDAARKLDAADKSSQEEPSSPAGEEECFCCCAHILPSLRFEMAEIGREPLISIFTNAILPIPPPQSPFHPPRFS